MSLSTVAVIFAFVGVGVFGAAGLGLGFCLWYYGVQIMAQYTLLPTFHPFWKKTLKVSLTSFALSVLYLVAIIHLMRALHLDHMH